MAVGPAEGRAERGETPFYEANLWMSQSPLMPAPPRPDPHAPPPAQASSGGWLDRLGLGWDELSELNPGLVYASITGYGATGPCTPPPRPSASAVLAVVSMLCPALLPSTHP